MQESAFYNFQVFLFIVREKLSIQEKMQAISICGHEYVTPEMHRIAKQRNGVASGIQSLQQILEIVKVQLTSQPVFYDIRFPFLIFFLQGIWTNKAKLKIAESFNIFKNRFSKENLSEFKDYTASQFNSLIEFEVDDEDRLGLLFLAHGSISMVSVFYQLISMLVLAEGATGDNSLLQF